MNSPAIPSIPVQLAHRPTLGGLVVPWVTARTLDGRYRFGAIDYDRLARALTDRLCQTCGQRLGRQIVFAMRDADLRLMISPEPGMHPVCVAYSVSACPMLKIRGFLNSEAPLALELKDRSCACGQDTCAGS